MKKNVALAMVFLALMAVGVYAQSESDFNVDLTKDGTGVVITGYTGKQAAVTIPAKIQGYPVKEIGAEAFSLGGEISRATSREYNAPIEIDAGTSTRLTSVTIPAGVERIGGGAFFRQPLTSVNIPTSVTFIGNAAFTGCSSLAAVNIPANVTAVGWRAFQGCSSLTTITIPASVTSIGDRVFLNCSKLATVNFSEGLVEIGSEAFNGCSALKTVKLPNSLTKLGSSVFSDSGLNSVTLGTGLTEIPANAFSYQKDPYGNDEDDNNYSGLPIKTIIIPEGVTKIGQSAFRSCKELTAVTLPSTLQSIEADAFRGCSVLTTVTIPDTLTSVKFGSSVYWGMSDEPSLIGVFAGCPKILLASRAALKKIGYGHGF